MKDVSTRKLQAADPTAKQGITHEINHFEDYIADKKHRLMRYGLKGTEPLSRFESRALSGALSKKYVSKYLKASLWNHTAVVVMLLCPLILLNILLYFGKLASIAENPSGDLHAAW